MTASVTASADALMQLLRRIDQKQYGAYKDLYGCSYNLTGQRGLSFSLEVVYVQGDPYAAPSRVVVRIPLRDAHTRPGLPPGRGLGKAGRSRRVCAPHRCSLRPSARCLRSVGFMWGTRLSVHT